MTTVTLLLSARGGYPAASRRRDSTWQRCRRRRRSDFLLTLGVPAHTLYAHIYTHNTLGCTTLPRVYMIRHHRRRHIIILRVLYFLPQHGAHQTRSVKKKKTVNIDFCSSYPRGDNRLAYRALKIL